jgi:PilZ domain
MKLGRGKNQAAKAIVLPKRSDVVTLLRTGGEQIPARVAERGPNTLVVLIMFPIEPLSQSELEKLIVEFPSPRGLVRLAGTVSVEDRDLLRFTDLHAAEVLQQREYVRVKANRPVLVYLGANNLPVQSYTVDLSGGGLLIAGPDMLEIGEEVQFQLTLDSGSVPIVGVGSVVRSDVKGRRAISFNSISDLDRRRLVKFIFECQRTERRRGLEVSEGRGD